VISARSAGRCIGVLLIVQAVLSYVEYFVLLTSLSGASGYLEKAATDASRIQVAVLLGLVNGALRVGIAIAAWEVFRRHSQAMALWFLALSIVGLSLMAMENVSILTMLSLSQEAVKAGSPEGFQAAGRSAQSTRYWAHYMSLIAGGGAGL